MELYFCSSWFGLINFLFMLQKILQNKLRIFFGFLFFIGLLAVRYYQENLFYDPLLGYFKEEDSVAITPNINFIKLFFSLALRYYFNSMLSIGILYAVFLDLKLIRFSVLLYIILGSVLLISFVFILHFYGFENKFTLFYVRRFLIQPIFLLLFLPAFYFQKLKK
jgi:exosortase F-associated protein